MQTRNSARVLITAVASVLLAAGAAGPVVAPPKGYVAVQARTPLVIDGKIDDASWADAPWTDDFQDIEGNSKPRPRFRTRAKMLWDDRYFYVAAELTEPHVWGTITKHDAVIFQDNDFEVFIDPDGDNHKYYELELNALNAEWDLLLEKPYRDGGPAVNAWEVPGLKTAVHVLGKLNDPEGEDQGWTVELAIPWDVLKQHAHRPAPPKDGDQWRVNFSRVEWRHSVEGKAYRKVPNTPEDNWVWSPQGVIDMHRPERWGYVQFSAEAPGKAAFRPDPTGPARDLLMTIYQAQKAHRKAHPAYASALADLDITLPPGQAAPRLRATPNVFEATIPLPSRPGQPDQVLKIRQDSRLTVEPAAP